MQHLPTCDSRDGSNRFLNIDQDMQAGLKHSTNNCTHRHPALCWQAQVIEALEFPLASMMANVQRLAHSMN
jgi:hypothetical protein